MNTVHRNHRLFVCAASLVLALALPWSLAAQDNGGDAIGPVPPVDAQDHSGHVHEAPPAAPATRPPRFSSAAATNMDVDPEMQEMMTEFDRLTTAWAEEIGVVREAQIRFHNGTDQTEQEYRQIVQQHQQVVRERFEDVFQQAIKMLRHQSEGQGYLKRFLSRTVAHRGNLDWYEGLAEAVDMLEQFLGEHAEPSFYSVAGRVHTVAGNFEKAKNYLQQALQTEEPQDNDLRLLATMDKLAEAYQAEQQRLADDPDDLPLVELNTTRGRVVIELYEDQAPNTVANFIQLVEQGFYDELPFYQVMEHLFAMTGDPYGDGTGNSGQYIPDEADHPDARAALHGSLVMAKLAIARDPEGRTVPDSASSQFMIMYLPMDFRQGKYTTFGRVVEGMSAVAYFTRIDPTKEKDENEVQLPPDRILTARVLRKRDHDYAVEYVERESAQTPAGLPASD